MLKAARTLPLALRASLIATGLLVGGAATVALAQGMGDMPGMANMPGTSNAPSMENMPGMEEIPGVSVGEGDQQNGALTGDTSTAPMNGMPMTGTPGMPMAGTPGMAMGGMAMMGMPGMAMGGMPMGMMGMGGAGNNQAAAGAESTDQKIEVLNRKIDALVERIERMGSSGTAQGAVPEPEITN